LYQLKRQGEGRRLTLVIHFNYKLIEINSLTLRVSIRVSIGPTSYTSTKLPEPMNDVIMSEYCWGLIQARPRPIRENRVQGKRASGNINIYETILYFIIILTIKF